ncbi:hypothetical protein A4R26_20895 [Niastella populi]|uniref:Uncharacterized protein n=1 Tax=Niastella populi TaxID=550983 RepID=A0A1V9FNL8_9BACT|nr:hypothetical protein A4R26_20895 [Niastella populi]
MINRFIILSLGLLGFLFSTCQAHRGIAAENHETDSLLRYNFRILDSVANAAPHDTIYYCCIAPIYFMELNTKLQSDAPTTFVGKMYFTRNNLIAWHNWYNNHRRRKNSSLH